MLQLFTKIILNSKSTNPIDRQTVLLLVIYQLQIVKFWCHSYTMGKFSSSGHCTFSSSQLDFILWVSCGPYFILWVSCGPYFILWVPCGPYFILWVSCGPYFILWVSCGPYFILWVSCGPYFILWVSCVPYFILWLSCGPYLILWVSCVPYFTFAPHTFALTVKCFYPNSKPFRSQLNQQRNFL